MKSLLLRPYSYANAKSWKDLEHVFTESLNNTLLDEMIQLLHIHLPNPRRRQSKYIRPAFYNRLDEIPRLLLSAAPSALRTSATPVSQQRPQVGATTGVQPDENGDEQKEQEHIDIPQERIADGKETEAVASSGDHEVDETRVNAAKAIQDAYRRYLERKRISAARKIQAVYRRHLKRKSVVRKGIEATQAHYWNLLRKRSKEMEWTKGSQYYLLFRVPLGYILVCLSAIEAFAESEKKEVRKRMMTEDHKGLEELVDALSQYRCDSIDCTLYRGSNDYSSNLSKKTAELQNKLSPSSKFHERRSVGDLQDAVQEVKAVLESLKKIPGSTATRNQIQKCWDRGWKWIFEKQGSRTKGKKAKKPKLVLDYEDLPYQ